MDPWQSNFTAAILSTNTLQAKKTFWSKKYFGKRFWPKKYLGRKIVTKKLSNIFGQETQGSG